MRTFQADYKFGIEAENDTLVLIRQFDNTLTKSKGRYSPFDFVNETNTLYVELKTRTFFKNKYPTTMLPFSKIAHCDKPDITYIFAFKFTDALSYIKYDKTLFDTFEVKEGGRWDRGRPELNKYIYIPIDKLTDFTSV